MGMFDHIYCEYPLPDGFAAGGIEFQSKDLDCGLDDYTITPEGRLIHHYREMEITPECDRPYPDRLWIGSARTKAGSEKMIDMNYHGFLNFYSSNFSGCGPNGFITTNDETPWSREYTAKFTDGRVVSIVLDSATIDMGNLKHITREEFHAK